MKIGLLDTNAYANIKSKFIAGEVELGIIKRDLVFLISKISKMLLLVSLPSAIIIALVFFIDSFINIIPSLKYSIILLLLLPSLYQLVYVWIDYKYDFWLGTNYRIFVLNNDFIFKSKYRPINFDQIEELSFSQKGIWQAMFKYGKVEISVKGQGDNSVIVFYYAKNPGKLIDKLSNAHAEMLKENKNIPINEIDKNPPPQFSLNQKQGFIKRSNPINKIDDHISDKIADLLNHPDS